MFSHNPDRLSSFWSLGFGNVSPCCLSAPQSSAWNCLSVDQRSCPDPCTRKADNWPLLDLMLCEYKWTRYRESQGQEWRCSLTAHRPFSCSCLSFHPCPVRYTQGGGQKNLCECTKNYYWNETWRKRVFYLLFKIMIKDGFAGKYFFSVLYNTDCFKVALHE